MNSSGKKIGISLSISEIAEDIIMIEPELTDESLINPERIKRVFWDEEYVIIAETHKILVFSKEEGKFVRSIGSRGQGPGEFTGIRSVTIDGKFLKEFKTDSDWAVSDMNYINDELCLVVEQYSKKDEKGLFNHLSLYRLNDEFQITDSCTIRKAYFERTGLFTHPYEDFILPGNSTVFLYCSDLYHNQQNPAEIVLRDTLYRIVRNHLIPELKLKFKNNGIDTSGNKFIQLYNIYNSSL